MELEALEDWISRSFGQSEDLRPGAGDDDGRAHVAQW